MGVSIGAARLWRALLALLVCACVLPAQGQAMELMTEDNPTLSGPRGQWGYDYRNQAWRGAGYIGARWVRAVISNKVGFSWGAADEFVETATARDVQPYLTLNYAPANSNGNPSSDPNLLPIPTENEFGAYCAAAANRYSGRVRHYSVFNEPNLFYWRTSSSTSVVSRIPAATYGALFRRCAAEIRAVDSSAKVYFGELTGGTAACTYLQNALTASSVTVADGLAFHPYQWDVEPGVLTGRRCSGISSLGDWGSEANAAFNAGTLRTPQNTRVPLMVTEFGYCVFNRQCEGAVRTLSEQGRADWIDLAYRLARDSGLVSVFSYYHLVDASDPNWNSGIIRAETAAPSLAATALRNAAGTTDPSATSGAATAITATGATLNGTVAPNGFRTTWWFEYGPTGAYGRTTSPQTVSAGGGPVNVSASVSGLDPITTHHYRLVVRNHVGSHEGGDVSFRTAILDDRPAVITGFNGVGVSTFVTNAYGTVRTSTRIGSTQTPWTTLGGDVVSAPAAARRRDGTVDLFALWRNGWVYRKTISPLGIESGWRTTGVRSVSAPAASLRRWRSGMGSTIDLVVRGEGNDLILRSFDTDLETWFPAFSLGGGFKSAPAVMSYYSESYHVYGRGSDDAIYQKYWDGTRMSDWASMGGTATSSPAVTSWYTSNIEVTVRGTDGALYEKGWNGERWGEWYRHDVQIDSAPAMTSERAGQMQIFARQGNQVVRRIYDNDEWGSWNSLGDPDGGAEPQDRIAVVEGDAGTAHLFVRDNAGVIRTATRTGYSQTAWTALRGGRVDSAPAAVRRRDGAIDVFALIGGTVQHKTITAAGVESAWRTTGVDGVSAPAASMRRWGSQVGSVIDLVVRGAGNDLVLRSFDTDLGTWHPAYSLGGSFKSAPAVMSYFDEDIHVYARGSDDTIQQKYWDGRAWSTWASLGGVATSSPAVTSWYPQNIEIAVRGGDGALYEKSWNGVTGRWVDWYRHDVQVDAAPTLSSGRAGQLDLYGRQNEYVIHKRLESGTWSDVTWLSNPSLRSANP